MGQSVSRKGRGARDHLLVIDQVNGERQVWALEVYAVIRRPELLRLALACELVVRRREGRQPHHQRQRRAHRQCPAERPAAKRSAWRDEEEVSKAGRGQKKPPERRQLT